MMVSNRFASGRMPLRVPPVCKKPTEPPDVDEPYPQQIVTYTYNVDVTWLWFRWTFAGARPLQREATMFGGAWRWLDNPVPPTTGERALFVHNPTTGNWTAGLWYWNAGTLRLVGQNTGNISDSPSPLATGGFLINFGAIWVGTRDGSVSS